MTDANGSYIFNNLLPGDYVVEFTPPASLPVSSTPTNSADDNVDGDDNGIQADTNGDGLTDGPISSPVITLTPGGEPTNEPGSNGGKDAADDENGDMTVDFGLAPLMSIGSEIFSDLNDNGIKDADEETIGEKGKTITLELFDANTGQLVATTQTNATGGYVFDNLVPGDYFIEFMAPDSRPISSTGSAGDDGVDNDDNGIQQDTNGDGITDGVITSPTISLVGGTEPTGEPGKATAAADNNSDFTIDFGLQACDITLVCPDPVVEECIEDFEPVFNLDVMSCCTITSSGAADPVLVSGTGTCDGVYSITYTVEDDCGKFASCEQLVTIENEIIELECVTTVTPVTCVADIDLTPPADVEGPCGQLYPVTVTGPTLVSGQDACFGATYSVEFSYTDECGRTTSCEQTYSIENQGPAITCPEPSVVFCEADIAAGLAVVDITCGLTTDVVTSAVTLASGDTNCPNSVYEIVHTVTDECGREATCTQVFTIENDAPTITCPADLVVECIDQAIIEDATFTTSCGLGATTDIILPVAALNNCDGDVYTYTHQVTDDCGRAVTCTQTVTISNTPPSLTCTDVTITCDQVPAFIPAPIDYEGPCGQSGSIDGTITTPYVGCGDGSMIVTYAGTDACGVDLTTECTVTVTGSGAGIVTCPVVAITCQEVPTFVPADIAVTTDCGGTGTLTGTITTPYTGCGDGSMEITYTGSDDCGNNYTEVCTATVTGAPPALVTCPVVSITCVEAPVFAPADILVSPDCGGAGTLTGTITTPYTGCGDGSMEVTYTGSDDCGNTYTELCSVTVSGAPAGAVTCPIVTITCDESATFEPVDISVTTDCGGAGILEGTITVPYTGCADGTMTVTYDGVDDCGNAYTETCTVEVTGAQPGVVTCPTVSITCNEVPVFTPEDIAVTTDCGGVATLTGQVTTPYTGCGDGSMEVTYTGNDACGNAYSELCAVTVTGAGAAIVTCPVVSITCEQAPTFVPADIAVTTDCGGAGTLTGTITVPYVGCGNGSMTLAYTGSDDCGNTYAETCTVEVSGAAAGLVTCPVVLITCQEAPTFVPADITVTTDCGGTGTLTGTITVPYSGCVVETVL